MLRCWRLRLRETMETTQRHRHCKISKWFGMFAIRCRGSGAALAMKNCAEQTRNCDVPRPDRREHFMPRTTNLLTSKSAFFLRLFFFFLPVLAQTHAWSFCEMFYYYFIFRSPGQHRMVRKIEKRIPFAFYRCLLRTFWACSCVLFKCPHGIRVQYYMKTLYCLSHRRAAFSVIRQAV